MVAPHWLSAGVGHSEHVPRSRRASTLLTSATSIRSTDMKRALLTQSAQTMCTQPPSVVGLNAPSRFGQSTQRTGFPLWHLSHSHCPSGMTLMPQQFWCTTTSHSGFSQISSRLSSSATVERHTQQLSVSLARHSFKRRSKSLPGRPWVECASASSSSSLSSSGSASPSSAASPSPSSLPLSLVLLLTSEPASARPLSSQLVSSGSSSSLSSSSPSPPNQLKPSTLAHFGSDLAGFLPLALVDDARPLSASSSRLICSSAACATRRRGGRCGDACDDDAALSSSSCDPEKLPSSLSPSPSPPSLSLPAPSRPPAAAWSSNAPVSMCSSSSRLRGLTRRLLGPRSLRNML
eukprot:Unigene15903_Nuclearia_a/m.47295 Unigene15903_Nuclearia_a/g.47295  ORF Unigene15903_Nuclearia_a/g.47295 Unigene15903_Nuclearia_a/m.47295 type:complete len:349 (-) Unigene15903_Nuclearia_a:173-1219(-)